MSQEQPEILGEESPLASVREAYNALRKSLDTDKNGELEGEEKTIDTDSEKTALKNVREALETALKSHKENMGTSIDAQMEKLKKNFGDQELLKNIAQLNSLIEEIEKEIRNDLGYLESASSETLKNAEEAKEEVKPNIDTAKNSATEEALYTAAQEAIAEGKGGSDQRIILAATHIIDSSNITPEKEFDLSDKDIISSVPKDIDKNEQEILKMYLTPKIEAAKKAIEPDEEKTMHLVKEGEEYEFITQKEYLLIKGEKEGIETQGEEKEMAMRPKWMTEDQFKAFNKSSQEQDSYKKQVKDKIGGSIFLKILNYFFGGSLASIAQGNSLLGRGIRVFTDIPKPPENHSPLTEEMKDTALTDAIVTSLVSKISPNSNAGASQSAIEAVTAMPKSKNAPIIARAIGRGFPDAQIQPKTKSLKKSTQYALTITPSSADQFTQIYSFLSSPVHQDMDKIKTDIENKAQKIPGGMGEQVSSGLNALTGVFNDHAAGLDLNEAGGSVLDFIAPESEHLESGHPAFSKVKNGLNFPPNLDIKTMANGDIIVAWNEEKASSSGAKKVAVKPDPDEDTKTQTT